MRQKRLQIRATPEELARWEKAAEKECLSLATWARRELQIASGDLIEGHCKKGEQSA